VVLTINLQGQLQVVAGLPMQNLPPEQVMQQIGDKAHESRREIAEEMARKGDRGAGVKVTVERRLPHF